MSTNTLNQRLRNTLLAWGEGTGSIVLVYYPASADTKAMVQIIVTMRGSTERHEVSVPGDFSPNLHWLAEVLTGNVTGHLMPIEYQPIKAICAANGGRVVIKLVPDSAAPNAFRISNAFATVKDALNA